MAEREYQERIDKVINSVHMAGIATKILQHMDRVRNVSDLSQSRRWGMELLQNARDVSYEEQPVRVRIRLEDEKLTFSHNGRPFRVKDILSIINQVSSKGGDSESIGKFGTGFVTTFQLSEEVEINSVIQEGELPYKQFYITLDRSGQSNGEILEAIGRAMESLRRVDDAAPMEEFQEDAYNTSFIYHLKTQESKKSAYVGMEDLQHSVFYILLFSKKIQEICLEFAMAERKETICYMRQKDAAISDNGLRRMDFEVKQKGSCQKENSTYTSIIYLAEGEITLAAGWQQNVGFTPLSEYTPRLFVDFPLIGAEQFPFPVVIGCRNFRTNEPRSGITLVDNPSSLDAPVNKNIICKAVQMYGRFLQGAISMGSKGLANILSIPVWQNNKEMSECWVRKNIYGALYQNIEAETFMETKDKKRPLNQSGMYLIRETDKEVRAKLRELLLPLRNVYVPCDDTDWYEALKNYPVPEKKIWCLDRLLEQAEILVQQIKIKGEDALLWLQKLYDLGMENKDANLRIRTGQVKILPNQANWEDGTLFTVNEVKIDPGIPEILKDVCEQLDKLYASNALESALEIRKQLMHSDFDGGNIAELPVFEMAKVEAYISNRSNRGFPVHNFNYYRNVYEQAWKKAWMLLLSCGPDEKLYELCKVVYQMELPEYAKCEGEWKNFIWKPAYTAVLNQVLEMVRSCETVSNLQKKYIEGEQALFDWLNGMIAKGGEYLPAQELNYKAIFPNQKGMLNCVQWLKKDETPDDILKDIAQNFADEVRECDFYKDVLDRRIRVEYTMVSVLTEEAVALRIHQTLQHILTTRNLVDTPMEYQMACTKLLEWMDMHTELAEKYFPAFASETDKVRLMTPGAVIGLQRKAKAVENVLLEAGVESIEALYEKLKNYQKLEKYIHLEEQSLMGTDTAEQEVYYSEDGDIFYGADLLEYDEEERQQLLRKIGIGGEKYALEKVKKYFIEKGYEILQEDAAVIELKKGEEDFVTIIYGDSGTYHQAGWDIMVKQRSRGDDARECNKEETAQKVYYIEVKSHTPGSCKRNQLCLSAEQMKLAARQGEHYAVMHVIYDFRKEQGLESETFVNPVRCLGEGRLNGCDRYLFWF